jgi:arylsulfatase A-like enzyme
VLEAAGSRSRLVNGVPAEPLEGVSMAYSFDDADAAERHETQYFETLGNRGIYHKGWTACDEASHAVGGADCQAARVRRRSAGSCTTRS